jgi:hypothetical protein
MYMLHEPRDNEGHRKIRLCGEVIRTITYSKILNETNTRTLRYDAWLVGWCQVNPISLIFINNFTYTSKLTGRAGEEQNFTIQEIISIFLLWTLQLYVATFKQHLHMKYISLSWSDIPELVVPIRTKGDMIDRVGIICLATNHQHLLVTNCCS